MATLYSNNLTNFNPGMAAAGSPQQWFIDQYNKLNPQLNYTTNSFNNAMNAGRTDLAYMQLAQGGQDFRDAVQQANHWTPDQMNSVINSYGLYQTGNNPTGMAAPYNAANIEALKGFGATSPAQPTYETAATSPNWVQNMNQQFGTGQGAVANPTSYGAGYGAGYTGYGNSVLAGPSPQGVNTNTTASTGRPTVTQSSGAPQYRGPVAPSPNANNQQVNTKPTGTNVAPAPTTGSTTSLGIPGTTIPTPRIVAPAPTRYGTLSRNNL